MEEIPKTGVLMREDSLTPLYLGNGYDLHNVLVNLRALSGINRTIRFTELHKEAGP